ncbi:MAG TPA: nucleoside monophosphate kinase [Candidatus Saccharimonadales bacterium]|nr:nucleoside monophosphate kinase [Candidatus Saccharimonadales bacterium]
MNAPNDRNAWLGGNHRCGIEPRPSDPCWRLVLLGPPGVGKGTQAQLLAHQLGACHLSTGDIFRAASDWPAGDRSPALEQAIAGMARGELVPDATVMEIIRERRRCLVCRGGFLLDGFPRTVAQAEALESLLQQEDIALDAVVNYYIADEILAQRLTGRRVCPNCRATYHISACPPREEGRCDRCGVGLCQRKDDSLKSVATRLKIYHENARPLVEFYGSRGRLATVQAAGASGEVFQRTLAAIGWPAFRT